MKTEHLLSGVAVIAALALSAPAWAQPANPSGGNSMGMPGPNMGGPGLTPYSGGAPPAASPPASTSAMPPKHHHAHAHHVASTHQMLHAHGPKSGTDTTAQLNQADSPACRRGISLLPGPARPRNGPACLGRNEPDASRRESDIEPDRWSLRPGPVNASSVGLVRDAAKVSGSRGR